MRIGFLLVLLFSVLASYANTLQVPKVVTLKAHLEPAIVKRNMVTVITQQQIEHSCAKNVEQLLQPVSYTHLTLPTKA